MDSRSTAMYEKVERIAMQAGEIALKHFRQLSTLPVTSKGHLDLVTAVADARAAGHADNSEAMVAAVRTALAPQYGTWTNFQNGLAGNVEGAVRWSGQ